MKVISVVENHLSLLHPQPSLPALLHLHLNRQTLTLRFGFKVIPSGCLSGIGGKTYQGSTGRTTTVTGIYGLSVAINASQTSCSSSTGVIKTTNAFTATATWPPVTLKVCALAVNTGLGEKFVLWLGRLRGRGAHVWQQHEQLPQECLCAKACLQQPRSALYVLRA
jgi:hypothetical protein